MTKAAESLASSLSSSQPRAVEFTRDALGHGPISAMMPTPALRERLKPFVFLDDFDVTTDQEKWGFPWHPHSGVATFTYTRTADLHHQDTGGQVGILKRGSVQWMAAGGGIWHQEYYKPHEGRVAGLQLWITLPPELENADVGYSEVGPGALPVVGSTRILAGEYEGKESPVKAPVEFNYFDVVLSAEDEWVHQPPTHHEQIWLHLYEGELDVGGQRHSGKKLVVFERAGGAVQVRSSRGARFVFGSAPTSPHPIVASNTSMHTSRTALEKGAARIAELGQELSRKGALR